MAAQSKTHGRARLLTQDEAAPGEMEPEWDAVSQASWESFPASDPPGWINPSRPDRAVPEPEASQVRHAG